MLHGRAWTANLWEIAGAADVNVSCVIDGLSRWARRTDTVPGVVLARPLDVKGDWRELIRANPSMAEMSLAARLSQNGISYRSQVELPVSICDFYFPTYPRPTVVYLDGPLHLKEHRRAKDEVLRTALRAVGYRVVEIPYTPKKGGAMKRCVDEIYRQVCEAIGVSSEPKPTLSQMIEETRNTDHPSA